MRLLILLILSLSLTPSLALAQSWKKWANDNPTYPEDSSIPSASPTPTSPQQPKPQPPAQSNQPNAQQPQLTNAFMQQCESAVTAEANRLGLQVRSTNYCACFLNQLQTKYTLGEIVTLHQYTERTGQMSQEVQEIINTCINEA